MAIVGEQSDSFDANGTKYSVQGSGSNVHLAEKRRDELSRLKGQSLAMSLIPSDSIYVAHFC